MPGSNFNSMVDLRHLEQNPDTKSLGKDPRPERNYAVPGAGEVLRSLRMGRCIWILEGGVLRCGFEDALPDKSFTLQLTRGDHNLYSLDLPPLGRKRTPLLSSRSSMGMCLPLKTQAHKQTFHSSRYVHHFCT